MLLDKAVKIIWLIIGILLLIGITALAYFIYEKENRRYDYYGEVEAESLIVGAELEKAKEKGVIIQHIQYDKPRQLPNSDYFVLPVFAKSYKQPISSAIGEDAVISELALESAEDPGQSNSYTNYSYYSTTSWAINLVFLDQDYTVIRTLLDQKAFIRSFRIPESRNYYAASTEQQDLPVKNITYTITFADTNADGRLNEEDAADLYISDLDGAGFKQVTKNIDVLDYHFMKDNTELLIEYKKRENKPEEQKQKLFATYNIATAEFSVLDALHEQLQQLNKDIRK